MKRLAYVIITGIALLSCASEGDWFLGKWYNSDGEYIMISKSTKDVKQQDPEAKYTMKFYSQSNTCYATFPVEYAPVCETDMYEEGRTHIYYLYFPLNGGGVESEIIHIDRMNKMFNFEGKEYHHSSSDDYVHARVFSEGLARIEQNGKYGFVDKKGKQVIPCIYDGAFFFSDGLAKVEQNGKYGFIDKKGKHVTLCMYDEAYEFYEGLARVEQNGKYGFIDKKGKQVVPCMYDYSFDFSDGLAQVRLNDYSGFIDKKGKQVIPCMYHYVYDYSEGLARVELNNYGFIDKKGKQVIPCVYDRADDFSEGLALVEQNGKYGFINKKGKQVVPCIYDGADSFSEGLALVVLNDKYGFIDKKGKQVIPCIYDGAASFSDGLALVLLDGTRGYINKKGEQVILRKNESENRRTEEKKREEKKRESETDNENRQYLMAQIIEGTFSTIGPSLYSSDVLNEYVYYFNTMGGGTWKFYDITVLGASLKYSGKIEWDITNDGRLYICTDEGDVEYCTIGLGYIKTDDGTIYSRK